VASFVGVAESLRRWPGNNGILVSGKHGERLISCRIRLQERMAKREDVVAIVLLTKCLPRGEDTPRCSRKSGMRSFSCCNQLWLNEAVLID